MGHGAPGVVVQLDDADGAVAREQRRDGHGVEPLVPRRVVERTSSRVLGVPDERHRPAFRDRAAARRAAPRPRTAARYVSERFREVTPWIDPSRSTR
jgi:hypothetical protein